MFNIWDVVEELAALAYEHHTKRISMSQIRKHLKAAKQDSPHSLEEVRKTLIQLGYHVRVQRVSPSIGSSIKRKDI